MFQENILESEKEEKIIITEKIEKRPETAKKPFPLERNNFKQPHGSSTIKNSEKRALSASIIKKFAFILFFCLTFKRKRLILIKEENKSKNVEQDVEKSKRRMSFEQFF